MSVEEKYKESYCEFKDLIQAGINLSMATGGVQVETRDLEVGSRIFAKLISHARALFILLPKAPAGIKPQQQELWDISSVAALARSLVDTYYVLYYIGIDNPGEKANEFRWLAWDYHAEVRRIEKLNLIGSEHPDIPDIEENIKQLKEQLVSHEEYQKLDSPNKKKIRHAKEATLLTNSELSDLAGIDRGYYKNTFMFLSSYVHSHPFSIEQLMSFRAGEEGSLLLINNVVQYASLYLSLAIRDFSSVLPLAVEIEENTQRNIDIWSGIAKDFSTFKMA